MNTLTQEKGKNINLYQHICYKSCLFIFIRMKPMTTAQYQKRKIKISYFSLQNNHFSSSAIKWSQWLEYIFSSEEDKLKYLHAHTLCRFYIYRKLWFNFIIQNLLHFFFFYANVYTIQGPRPTQRRGLLYNAAWV